MKKFGFLFLLYFLLSSVCYAQSFEMLKIKHRAREGFTNRGRIIYEYVDDSDISGMHPNEIGVVDLDRRSRVREVHVGVNLKDRLRFDRSQKDRTLRIGEVEANGNKSLRRVNINVNVEEDIDF